MNDKKCMRKKIYVSRIIQGRLLGRLAVYWGVYHVVLWHAMFLYRYMQYRGELLAGATPIPFHELFGTFMVQHYSMIVCAAAVFPIVFWDMTRQTHRVAGPLVRFQNALQQLVREERVEKIRLRKGDLLIEFQDAFNEFLDSTGRAAGAAERPGEDRSQAAATDDPASGEHDRLLDDLQEIEQSVDEEKATRGDTIRG